jgi:hypothetical protein
MKKLIGVVSAVFFVLLLTGPAFASDLPMEETIEQEMQAIPEDEATVSEEDSVFDSQITSELADAEISVGGEAPLAVWSSRDIEAPAEQSTPSRIDSVKVDLSVDDDGQTFMPPTE